MVGRGGVGADNCADGEDVGVEVDVPGEVDLGHAVHAVAGDVGDVPGEIGVVVAKCMVGAELAGLGHLVICQDDSNNGGPAAAR